MNSFKQFDPIVIYIARFSVFAVIYSNFNLPSFLKILIPIYFARQPHMMTDRTPPNSCLCRLIYRHMYNLSVFIMSSQLNQDYFMYFHSNKYSSQSGIPY